MFVFQGTLSGTYYMFTTYLQDALGYGPLAAGLAFLPLTVISMAVSAKATGALLARWGLRATLFSGLVVTGVGMAALAAGMSVHGSLWAVLPGLVVWGIGGGATFPAMFVAASSGVDAREQGVASGLANTARMIGGAVGLAVMVAIALAGVHAGPGAPPASVVVDGLRGAAGVAGVASIASAFIAIALSSPREEIK